MGVEEAEPGTEPEPGPGPGPETVRAPVEPLFKRWGRAPVEPFVATAGGDLVGKVGSRVSSGGLRLGRVEEEGEETPPAEHSSMQWGRASVGQSLAVTVIDDLPVVARSQGSSSMFVPGRVQEERARIAPAEPSSTSGSKSSFVTAPVDEIDAPVVSRNSSGAAREDVAERGATASSARIDFLVDTLLAAAGYNEVTDTFDLEPRVISRPQPGDPQLPLESTPAAPDHLQLPNDLSRVTAITLLVEDLDLTRRFYEQILLSAPIHEDENSAAFLVNDGELTLNLYSSADSGDNMFLGDDLPVGRGKQAGRRVQLSVAVGDVDVVYARLRGLEDGEGEGKEKGKERPLVVEGLREPQMRPWGVRTVMFQDPAGHCWEVSEEGG